MSFYSHNELWIISIENNVSIITHVFLPTAKAMTRMMGVPDFDYIIAEHPLSSLTDEQVKERAAQLAPEVERILLGKEKNS